MGEYEFCFHRGLLGQKETSDLALLWNIVHLLLLELLVIKVCDFVNRPIVTQLLHLFSFHIRFGATQWGDAVELGAFAAFQ
jgi:hypothetical protein